MTEQICIDMIMGVLANATTPLTHKIVKNIELILTMNLKAINKETGEKYLFLTQGSDEEDIVIDLYNYGRSIQTFSMKEIKSSLTKALDWKIYGF